MSDDINFADVEPDEGYGSAVGDEAEIRRLAELPRLEYERQRGEAAEKLGGIRLSVLDAAVNAARGTAAEASPAQRDALLAIGAEGGLWIDDADDAHVTVEVDGHFEHYRLRSNAYRRLLVRLYGDRHQIDTADGPKPLAPGGHAVSEALNALDALAARGRSHEPAIRVGHFDGKIYLDLADPSWRAVEIDRQGWRVVDRPPVRFIRPPGLRPLPEPSRSSDGLMVLRRTLDLKGEAVDLALAWLIGCFLNRGPYPVLVPVGQADAGKTTLLKMLRRLIDPNRADTRSRPRDERDLMIAARNSRIIALDNLSQLDGELSDALCRLAVGGGLGTRTNYTDAEETLFEAARPVILNGIPDLARNADLIDRCVVIHLRPRSDEGRVCETDLWAAFYTNLPKMLGGLLDVVSMALRRWPEVKLARYPRMADWCRWNEAAAPALGWEPGYFTEIYELNRLVAAGITLEDDPLAEAVKKWAASHKRPSAKTASEWLELLGKLVQPEILKARGWPRTAHALSEKLRRLAPALKRAGICTVDRSRTKHERGITIVPL